MYMPLRKHMIVHDKSGCRPTACTYCGKEFPTYPKMTAHRRVSHRQQWEVDKERLMAAEGSHYQGKYKDYFNRGACTYDVCTERGISQFLTKERKVAWIW